LIGKRLRMLREEKGQKQADIAKVLGVSRTTYTQYETEKSEPDLETVKRLAEYFNTTADYLLGRTDDPHPTKYKTADALIAFSGDTSDLNVEALERIIKEAVREAIDERDRDKDNQ